MVDNFTSGFSTFLNELNNITNTGRYEVKPKIKPADPTEINLTSPAYTSSGGGGSELDRLIAAIKGQESSDNYSAVNPDSGAAGAYQIMPSNWQGTGGWDRDALGYDVSYDQFMNSSEIQDAIARYKLNQYLEQYGAAGAAVAWYGGPGAVDNMYDTNPQAGGYPSLYAYWTSVLNRM